MWWSSLLRTLSVTCARVRACWFWRHKSLHILSNCTLTGGPYNSVPFVTKYVAIKEAWKYTLVPAKDLRPPGRVNVIYAHVASNHIYDFPNMIATVISKIVIINIIIVAHIQYCYVAHIQTWAVIPLRFSSKGTWLLPFSYISS